MKQISGVVLLLSFALFTASCSKNVSGIEKTDKAEVLFQQVKNDANFINFSRIMLTNVEIFKENALISKDRKLDSAVLRNEKLTLKQKYDSLHFSGYQTVNDNNFKLYNLMMYLQKNYPLFGELTSEERSRFVKLSGTYVKKLDNQQ
jgi:hypothetical protein